MAATHKPRTEASEGPAPPAPWFPTSGPSIPLCKPLASGLCYCNHSDWIQKHFLFIVTIDRTLYANCWVFAYVIKVPDLVVKVKDTQSCPTVCDPMDYTVHGILQARTLEWVSLSLLQGIFPTQGSNPGLLHCRRILYQLSHQGSPRILEWMAFPLSTGSSQPRNRTSVPCTAGGFFTSWDTRKEKWVKQTGIDSSWCLVNTGTLIILWKGIKYVVWARSQCLGLGYPGSDELVAGSS